MLNMIVCLTHSGQPRQQYNVDFPKEWKDWWERFMLPPYREYYRQHEEVTSQAIPTYFLRYEDLIAKPVEVLTELFCFLLNVPSIEGTVIEQRILKATANSRTNTCYKLKKNQDYSKLLRNTHMYSDEQIAQMKEQLK